MSKVAEAIAKIMADIKRLGKEEKNAHGGYMFASIDDFLDLTRPLCAKHGLAIYQDETGFEVLDGGNGNKSLLMQFAFTLEAGDETKGPFHRSILVPAKMGSQAFGAGQSYALKQFLRATFQIATGDKDDIDHHDTGELGTVAPRRNDGVPAPRQKLEGPYTSKTALWTAVKNFDREIRSCGDIDQLEALLADKDTKALVEQCMRDAPAVWETGEGMPPEFVPLDKLIRQTRDELNIREAA